jgi:AcrR family transcriptional regulator
MTSRREEIIEIAGELFARKGFASATVREIADEAGILSGSLYHHFDSKETIAEEILADYYEAMIESYRTAARDHVDEKALAELIRVAFRGIAEKPHAVALIDNSAELLFANERFAHLRAISDELEQIWVKVIRSAVRQGAFRSEIDAPLVRRLIRDNLWVVIRWWRPEGRLSIEQLADQYIDLIFNGLLAPPKPAARKALRPKRAATT